MRSASACHHPAAQQFLKRSKPESHTAKRKLQSDLCCSTNSSFPAEQIRDDWAMPLINETDCWINDFAKLSILITGDGVRQWLIWEKRGNIHASSAYKVWRQERRIDVSKLQQSFDSNMYIFLNFFFYFHREFMCNLKCVYSRTWHLVALWRYHTRNLISLKLHHNMLVTTDFVNSSVHMHPNCKSEQNLK